MIWKSLERKRPKKFEDNLFKHAFDWESLLIFHALGIPVTFFFASRGFWNWTQTDIYWWISPHPLSPTHQRDQALVPVLELEVPPTSLATDTLCDPILGHDVATCTGSLQSWDGFYFNFYPRIFVIPGTTRKTHLRKGEFSVELEKYNFAATGHQRKTFKLTSFRIKLEQ